MRKNISLFLKAMVVLFATVGTILSMKAGNNSFMGGTTVLMYFTIQSNIGLAVLCLIGAIKLLRKEVISDRWYVIKFVGTISITLTGAVFCFVLAPTLGEHAWTPVNIFTHVIVPVAAIADFFVTGIDSNIPKRKIPYITIPPILYVLYATVGYVCNWQFSKGINYPYFFLNWGSEAGAFGFSKNLPFMGCMWWILVLMVLLLLISLGYLCVLDVLKRRFVKD